MSILKIFINIVLINIKNVTAAFCYGHYTYREFQIILRSDTFCCVNL